MPRLALLIVTALLLAAPARWAPLGAPAFAAPDAAPETETVEPGFENPRAVFDAAKTAFNERQWDQFLACVTAEQRSAMVGEMVAAMELFRQQPGADPRLGELMSRFFAQGVPADALSQDPKTRRAAATKLVEALDSPADFFGSATDLALALEHGADSASVRVETLGDLRPVKTAGGASNRAVRAEVALRLPNADKPRRDVWTFVVQEKRWFLAPLGVE